MSAKKKLLVVDDNVINRQILCKILCDQYELLEAENGRVALKILEVQAKSISAILLDLTMPVMNGYEVMEAVRGDALFSMIPIIVTTASNDTDTEEKALSLGANDFILKPYKPSIIKHRIANTINLRETSALINIVQKDAVTGLLKKEFFYQQMGLLLKNNPDCRYDILCTDITRFKLVNDLFGMKVGDELLRYMADLIRQGIPTAVLSGRIGADQFACLLPHRDAYENSFFVNAIKGINRFPITISLDVSFGIYEINDTTVPVNVMCDRALIACNSVKGKYDVNFSYYTDEIRKELLSEQCIVDNMKIGIEEKQFQVYYQPKYDVATEKVSGAEALVRWIHPEKGFMPPDQFIPLFEKNGFITQLDFYVWDTVCAVLRGWLDDHKKITPISVNVSRTDIYNPDLPNILMDLIRKYGLKPHYLHLEITETAYTQNPTQLIHAVKQLKKLGFIIEMDDFGSGYSSLNMLSQMPLDILKLDIQFIQNETKKNSSKNILSFVISLAKWLNLAVVAEGVETKEQLEILRNMDCTYVQGYYYAKPMPLAEFEAHLRKALLEDIDQKPVLQLPAEERVAVKIGKSDRIMMIVDDVELNRTVLSEIFSDSYTIVEADNGKTAYQYLLENYEYVDIILLDLVMPVMDGFQLLAKLKESKVLRNIPVIVTSQTGENSEVRALSMGASDFIGKPYNVEVARHRVNNVLAESRLELFHREKELAGEIEEMRYKAEHDSLTGLYNRTALETKVNTFFSGPQKPGGFFIMIDIDNFKTINDVFGHDKGDEVLSNIAKLLSGYFASTDVVTRLGGDEFAVFSPAPLLPEKINKLVYLLCKKLQLEYGGIEISATAGVAIAPQQGADYQTLYKKADTALLFAKRLGKNQYKLFDDGMELPSPVLTRNLDWLLDETSDAILVCNSDNYDVLYVNHGACEISGKSRKEMGGRKCYDFLWGRTEPCSHCVPMNEMTKAYCEHEFIDPASGKSYIIKGKLTEWGGSAARIQFIQDNTDRALVAWQLAEISADRKRILDLMPCGIFRYSADSAGTFDFVSENLLKMLGYTREAFDERFGNRFENLIWHEDRSRVLKEIAQQVAAADSDVCQYRIEKADGTLCWVHDIGHLVKDKKGRAWFYVAIMDVTAEHHTTEKLTEERKKLQIALSHSRVQYWEHDLRTDVAINGVKGADMGFANVTPNYSRFLVESGIIPPEYVSLYAEKQQALYDGATGVSYEIPLYDPRGVLRWWHICCTNLFDDEGKPIKTIGTAEEIQREKPSAGETKDDSGEKI